MSEPKRIAELPPVWTHHVRREAALAREEWLEADRDQWKQRAEAAEKYIANNEEATSKGRVQLAVKKFGDSVGDVTT